MGFKDSIGNSVKGLGKGIGGYTVGKGKGLLASIINFLKTNMKRVP
jgi:hypothetical protein